MFQRIPKLNILPQPKNDQEEKTQTSTLHITSQIVPDGGTTNQVIYHFFAKINPLNKNVALFVQLEKCFSFAKILFP